MIIEKIKDLNHTLFRQGYQDGAALIFFISIILAMSVLTGYMLDLTTTSTLGELSYNHLERAYSMAEAGGNYANNLVKLDIETDGTYDDTYSIHNKTFTLDDSGATQEGQFKIMVDDTNSGYTLVHSIGTISSGISSNVEVKITYSMNKTSFEIFDQVLFAKNAINLKKDVTIVGDLATNDSSVSKDPIVTITGDEEINAGITLTPIIFACGNCVTDKNINSSETWFDGTYEYLNVTIQSNEILTISGDVILYVKEDFFAGIGSTIKLFSNSSLIIYVDNSLTFKKDFSVEFDTQPDRAKDLVIYGTSNADTISLEKEITFIGAIYAPTADIYIKKAQIIGGTIVGNTITVDQGATIVYDHGVKDIVTPVGGTMVLSFPKQYFSS